MSDNTRLIVKIVEHYMGIVNTTILDMTPKYISKELVQEVTSHLILVYFGISMGNYTENHSQKNLYYTILEKSKKLTCS